MWDECGTRRSEMDKNHEFREAIEALGPRAEELTFDNLAVEEIADRCPNLRTVNFDRVFCTPDALYEVDK